MCLAGNDRWHWSRWVILFTWRLNGTGSQKVMWVWNRTARGEEEEDQISDIWTVRKIIISISRRKTAKQTGINQVASELGGRALLILRHICRLATAGMSLQLTHWTRLSSISFSLLPQHLTPANISVNRRTVITNYCRYRSSTDGSYRLTVRSRRHSITSSTIKHYILAAS